MRRHVVVPLAELTPGLGISTRTWIRVGKTWDFPHDGGAAVKHGKSQIAVFNFSTRGQWYATQNMCPHKQAFVLARGVIGDARGTPKVACPLHKKSFSLESGACLSGENYSRQTFPVKIEGDDVYLQLPPPAELDAVLAAEHFCPSAAATCGMQPTCHVPREELAATLA